MMKKNVNNMINYKKVNNNSVINMAKKLIEKNSKKIDNMAIIMNFTQNKKIFIKTQKIT